MTVTSDANMVGLAEELRSAVSLFVRSVRMETGTPSSPQSEALEMLERFGPASIAAVAKRRKVRHQSMRQTLGQLEAGGLARRDRDPADGRAQLFTITREGRAWLRRSRETRVAWIAALIEQKLGTADRAQVQAAVALLRRLIEPVEPQD